MWDAISIPSQALKPRSSSSRWARPFSRRKTLNAEEDHEQKENRVVVARKPAGPDRDYRRRGAADSAHASFSKLRNLKSNQPDRRSHGRETRDQQLCFSPFGPA